MTEPPLQEESIFLQALDRESAEERAAYLDQVCGDNEKLRAEVEALLRANQKSGDLLDLHESADQTIARPISEEPGTVIGPYKLLQQIGEGGMGVVFMAEQTEPIQRNVALKIIKQGMDTRRVIARFEAERQALAMMDHPNIAKVLDAGTTDSGRPYFVMELVKGVSITEYCDDNTLSLRQRLELFKPICEAVQHAHQKGVIHRDLKPTNVLVAEYDSRPVPKVIDFGVAKATAQKLTERTMFTEFGQVIGTIEYMSPEQAKLNQLDIDTRSDIYSLGVLLYELLTGTTPFERQRLREAAFDEVLRIIREEEPPNPSTRLSTIDTLPSVAANRHTEPARLNKDLRGELDWIVMKCLEKDRNRRYETATGLAQDIGHYLADEQVRACPPSAAYRFRKFARRNKAALLIATTAVSALLLTVLGLAISNRMIIAERNEKAAALLAKERALAAEAAARKRSEANFWQAVISVRDVVTGTAMGGENVPEALRKKFAIHALKFYEALLKDDSLDPSLKYETAIGYRTIATIHSSSSEYDRAEVAFQKSIGILERLVAEQPANTQYRHQLGYADLTFSRMLVKSGRSQQASAVIDHGIRLYEKLVAEYPSNYEHSVMLAHFYVDKLNEHVRAKQKDAAMDVYQKVSAVLDKAETLTPEQPLKSGAFNHVSIGHRRRNVAGALEILGEYEASEAMLRKAILTFQKLAHDEPDVESHWHFWADTHRGVASMLRKRQHPDEAAREIERAVDIHEQRMARFPHESINIEEVANAFSDRGHIYLERGELEKAIADYSQAIRLKPDGWWYWHERAYCHLVKGKHKESIADHSRAIELSDNDAGQRLRRGQSYEALGKIDEAEADFSKAVELNPKYWDNWLSRARLYVRRDKWDKAEADLNEAIKVASTDVPIGTNSMSWALSTWFHPRLGKPEVALKLAKEAVAAAPTDANLWNTLGMAQYRNGNWQEAIKALEKSMELRSGGRCADWFFLAMSYWKSGDKGQARVWYDKAVEWMDKNQPKNEELKRFRKEAEELLHPASEKQANKS